MKNKNIMRGGIIKHPENLILIRKDTPIMSVSQNINFKPFTVNLDYNNPMSNEEIKKIAEIIIKHLHKD